MTLKEIAFDSVVRYLHIEDENLCETFLVAENDGTLNTDIINEVEDTLIAVSNNLYTHEAIQLFKDWNLVLEDHMNIYNPFGI